jgi:ABC-type sulfate/molybdate transport systems ATPase subunit
MSGEVVLRARDLIVRPGGKRSAFCLRVPALDLVAGETLAVLGPNGAGKSTLLRALAGLERSDGGTIEQRAPGSAGMVFQRPVSLAGSVEHNVRVALWGRGMTRAAVAARAGRELERFGIAQLARRSASALSGGEMRRLALARAFAVNPAVLLLDEPFDDLDATGQENLSLDLERVVAETGVAVAMVTHELPRALLLADRLAVLLDGRLAQVGPREEVLRRPVHPGVARVVGMVNLVPGTVEAAAGEGRVRIRIGPDHAVVAAGEPAPRAQVLVGMRPEHLKVDVGRGEGDPIGKGIVLRTLSDGTLVTVTIAWADTLLRTHLLAGRGLGHTLSAGDAVSLRVRPEDVHLLDANPLGSA